MFIKSMKLSEEQKAKILRFYNAGYKLGECAKMLGIDRKTLYRWRCQDREFGRQIKLIRLNRQAQKLIASTERFFAKHGVTI